MKVSSVLVVAVEILAVILIAEVPCYSQNNVIYGCVTKQSGQLRIVSAPGQCKSNEALISWNITGPPGVANGISRAVQGSVAPDGTIWNGTGFSTEHFGAGIYKITFNQAFASLPTCTPSTFYNYLTDVDVCVFDSVSVDSILVDCFTIGENSIDLSDRNFSFICVQ